MGQSQQTERERFEDAALQTLKMEEGALSQGMLGEQLLKLNKGRKPFSS